MSDTDAHPRLSAQLLREVHQPDHGRHWRRLGAFIAIYSLGAWAVWWISQRAGDNGWLWLLAVPLYILVAAALHGISLFTHEAVHGTLARNRVLNRVLGATCAIPVLQNCSAYRVLHLRHHDHLGEDGDPDHYANYTRWSWMVFLMNWLRLLVGYPVYITAIPFLGFKHGTTRDRGAILLEIAATVAVVALIWQSGIPRSLLVHGWLIPMLVINFMVNIRGMSQHTLLPQSHDEIRGTRSILTSRIVTFFMCHENLHLEHHLYPGVPWYHLPQVHAALKNELAERGAPYIGSYSAFVLQFMVHSVRISPWGRRGQ